jgi:hypothetical protein
MNITELKQRQREVARRVSAVRDFSVGIAPEDVVDNPELQAFPDTPTLQAKLPRQIRKIVDQGLPELSDPQRKKLAQDMENMAEAESILRLPFPAKIEGLVDIAQRWQSDPDSEVLDSANRLEKRATQAMKILENPKLAEAFKIGFHLGAAWEQFQFATGPLIAGVRKYIGDSPETGVVGGPRATAIERHRDNKAFEILRDAKAQESLQAHIRSGKDRDGVVAETIADQRKWRVRRIAEAAARDKQEEVTTRTKDLGKTHKEIEEGRKHVLAPKTLKGVKYYQAAAKAVMAENEKPRQISPPGLQADQG